MKWKFIKQKASGLCWQFGANNLHVLKYMYVQNVLCTLNDNNVVHFIDNV